MVAIPMTGQQIPLLGFGWHTVGQSFHTVQRRGERIVAEIGQGTFGRVYRAIRLQDGAVVVLKKILVRRPDQGLPKAVLREIQAYQQVQHAHVLRLLDYYATRSSVVLVLDAMRCDLQQVLRELNRTLTEAEIKDLKPSNILFDAKGRVNIGDMGLARIHVDDGRSYSHQVATRHYRAPELLYGARHYDFGVDLWAVGCVFGEMLTGAGPVFPGQTDIDQLFQVVRVLGTPSSDIWPGVENLPDFDKIQFSALPSLPFAQLFPDVSDQALDLLQRFLVYDSSKRIDPVAALEHDFFFTEPYPVSVDYLQKVVLACVKPGSASDNRNTDAF